MSRKGGLAAALVRRRACGPYAGNARVSSYALPSYPLPAGPSRHFSFHIERSGGLRSVGRSRPASWGPLGRLSYSSSSSSSVHGAASSSFSSSTSHKAGPAGEGHEGSSDPRIRRVEELLAAGQREEANGKSDAALQAYRDASKLVPDAPTPHGLRAQLLAREGRMEEALQAYHDVLRCVPDHPATCVAVAQCLASLGRHEEALKQLQRVLDAHPKNIAALGERGTLYLQRGQIDEALADWKSVLHIEERNASAWLGLAKARILKGKMKTAKKALELALRFSEEDWTKAQKETSFLAGFGVEIPKEEAQYTRVNHKILDRRRNFAATLSLQGVLLQLMGDLPQALEFLTRAINTLETPPPGVDSTKMVQDKKDSVALSDIYCKRASHLLHVDRYEESQRDCDAALQHYPQNHQVRLIRGQCLMMTGRFAEAMSDLRLYLQANEAGNKFIPPDQRQQVQELIQQCEQQLKSSAPPPKAS